MIFFVVMPLPLFFENHIVPLQIGGAGHGFSVRLNALGFWLVPSRRNPPALQHLGRQGAPAVGWFTYAPLNEKRPTPRSSGWITKRWRCWCWVSGR